MWSQLPPVPFKAKTFFSFTTVWIWAILGREENHQIVLRNSLYPHFDTYCFCFDSRWNNKWKLTNWYYCAKRNATWHERRQTTHLDLIWLRPNAVVLSCNLIFCILKILHLKKTNWSTFEVILQNCQHYRKLVLKTLQFLIYCRSCINRINRIKQQK